MNIVDINLKEIKKDLLKRIGKPCPDYDAICISCRYWRSYEEFEWMVNDIIDTEEWAKKKI